MQTVPKRVHLQIALTQMRRRKTRRLIRVTLFVMLSTFLVAVDNIKSNLNQDLFQFVNGYYNLNGSKSRRCNHMLRLPKFELDTLELMFHTHFICVSSPLELG